MTEEIRTKGKRTREDILQAAYELFIANGYHGTSMRQIAERAGIALGGIYNHFTGKEQIFKEVIIRFHPIKELVPLMEQAEGETVAESMRAIAHIIQGELSKRREYLNLLFVEIVEFQAAHLSAIFKEVVPVGLRFAEGLFRRRGQLRGGNVPLMMFAFLVLMFGYFFAQSFVEERVRLPLLRLDLDRLVDIYLYGILADRPEKG
ncbi:MAG: TetR/AcrR family transcriptional regulator [Chloroflexi bacterium]|nr:TetR/AcrR family transcriptional regulator [Chloroflexota bacterium]